MSGDEYEDIPDAPASTPASNSPRVPKKGQSPSAMFQHVSRAYSIMAAEAVELEDGRLIYEGYLTHLVTKQMNLSTPYYTSIKNHLVNMQCIVQLKRGGGTSPSQWELSFAPSIGDFNRVKDASGNTKVKNQQQKTNESLEQKIRNMNERMITLEKQMKAVLEVLNK
jgi:hypothetical protein